MWRGFRIFLLRMRAERAYREYLKLLDEVDCRAALAEHMLPGVAKARGELADTLAQLRELGYRPGGD